MEEQQAWWVKMKVEQCRIIDGVLQHHMWPQQGVAMSTMTLQWADESMMPNSPEGPQLNILNDNVLLDMVSQQKRGGE